MVKEVIAELIRQAAEEAQRRGLLPPCAIPEIRVERPQNPGHGDYASSLPLKLARVAGQNPLDIARNLASLFPASEEISQVTAAPPGFVNFRLSGGWLSRQVEAILEAGEGYGNLDLGKGQKVQVEFVSVNPTGPLHVGHGRGAVLGSTLARLLEAGNYRVTKEYYINDAGTQIEAFAHSLYARYLQALGQPASMPSEGYMGAYLVSLAQEIAQKEGEKFLKLPPEQAVKEIGGLGVRRMLAEIKRDLEQIGVAFDVWFGERSLYSQGQYSKAMALLQQKGFTEEREGAVWFASKALGEDKDNVLVRSSGLPTYFASDVAYHYNKFLERGFALVINIWGADHQGHVPRMKAVIQALDIDPSSFQVIISQMVTLRRGENVVKISKRTGELITLREVVEEVGADACRYFFITRSPDSQMDFDLELAKEQSLTNPVYYLQYAYARIASILRLAQEKAIDFAGGDVSLLTHPVELDLLRKMVFFPELMEMAITRQEPHHLPHYALELATLFHGYYQECRVIAEDEALTKARLKLVKAVQTVLGKVLRLMGMAAPERM